MKKAVLVVSFGTSYKETREKTIEACEKKIKEGLEGYDFFRAFTSALAPGAVSEVGIPADPATLDKLADHAGDVGGSYRRITRDDARAILASCVTPVVF